jgi:hypothetical protein
MARRRRGALLKREPPRRRIRRLGGRRDGEGSSGCSPATTSAQHSCTGFGPLSSGPAQPAVRRVRDVGTAAEVPGLETELRHRGVCVLVTMGAPAPATETRADLRIGRAGFMISDERLSQLTMTRGRAWRVHLRRGLEACLAGVCRRATAGLGEGVACINLVGRMVGHEQVRRSERLFDDGLSGPRNGKSKSKGAVRRCLGSD